MKFLSSAVLILMALTSTQALAQWTVESPKEALLIKIEASCLVLKGTDGKTFKVQKHHFDTMKLETGKTKIKYYPEGAKKYACD